MRTVNAKCGSVIPLGRLGENEATVVVFDITNWVSTFGDGGVFSLLNVRSETENTAYPCDIDRVGNEVRWEVKSADVANVGYGKCELVYMVGDTIAKSEVFTTVVGKALTGGGEVPEPWEDWVERVLQAGADAQDAKYAWENMSAVGVESETAYAEYADGVLTIGVPKGEDGVDATINGVNTINIVAGDNITIEQDGDTLTINGEAGGGGGGTSDHRQLSNRDAANQHPISAITGLQSALGGKQPIGDYATTQDVSDLADIVDTKADASDIPSLDGYATEQWVENQGYLTEHQSLAGYATETYVDNHHDDTKQDAISDLAAIRSGAALGTTAVQPEDLPDYPEVDTEPTEGSDNLITSGAVFDAMQGGGGKTWELIRIVDIAESSSVIEVSTDENGSPFTLDKVAIFGTTKSAGNSYALVSAGYSDWDNKIRRIAAVTNGVGTNGTFYVIAEIIGGAVFTRQSSNGSLDAGSEMNMQTFNAVKDSPDSITYKKATMSNGFKYFKFETGSSSNIYDAGTHIEIWGVRR